MLFSSDADSATARGFRLRFEEKMVACGGQLRLTNSLTSGFFSSPNYPANYPPNADCSWVITSPPSEHIQLDFVDQFEIEPNTLYVHSIIWYFI